MLNGCSFQAGSFARAFSIHKVYPAYRLHYNPWVLKRQKLLESNVQRSWRDDPLLLSMGTRRVRREDAPKANLFITGGKEVVPAGESNHDRSLKTRKLLILQNAKNDRNYKNADNWNVSGTRH